MVPQHNTPRGSALGAGPNNILHEHPTTQRHLTGVLTSVTRPVENRGLSRANQVPEDAALRHRQSAPWQDAAFQQDLQQRRQEDVLRNTSLVREMLDVHGQPVLVQVNQSQQRASPAEHMARAKMPAPPKFGGVLDSDISSIEVWVRDVQRYAHRIQTPVKEVLEVLTKGPARVNVDNMLRDPATAALSDDAFVDKLVMFYMQQAQPKHMQARDKLYSGAVCMTPGSSLQAYVMQFRSVIMDAEPILLVDKLFYFKQGLQHELKAECLTDALGQPFTSLDALVDHAFVKEQQLCCKRSAPASNAAAELNHVQGAHRAAKRVRFEEHDGQLDIPHNSGRTEFEQRVYQLAMEFDVCGGCLGFLGDDDSHFWQDCPLNPKNAQW